MYLKKVKIHKIWILDQKFIYLFYFIPLFIWLIPCRLDLIIADIFTDRLVIQIMQSVGSVFARYCRAKSLLV